jgi:protocatechuate 3,4-dioxygenase beta subunit
MVKKEQRATTRFSLLTAVLLSTLPWGSGLHQQSICRRAYKDAAGKPRGLYPNASADTDNDLIVINESLTPAVGEITYLSGRILDSRGEPIRNALVEIWQVDKNGSYLHTKSDNYAKRDANFQGFGRFLTGSTGDYLFRTIKPVPYPGRCPHIHFAIKLKGHEKFTTQCYLKGEPLNETDGVLKKLPPSKGKDSLMIPFTPLKGSRAGELAARFDIVMGFTPEAYAGTR